MELLTTAALIGATVLIGAICAYIFKVFTRETTFEEAYGKNALKLLTEEKIQKAKAKAVKAKKPVAKVPVRERPAPVEKPEQEKPSIVEPVKETIKAVAAETSASVKQLASTAKQNMEQATATAKKHVEQATTSAKQIVQEAIGSTEIITAGGSSDAHEDVSAKKNKKKKAPKKADVVDDDDEWSNAVPTKRYPSGSQERDVKSAEQVTGNAPRVEELIRKVEVTAQQQAPVVQKVQLKKDVRDDISLDDVIKRLKSVKSVEPEFIEYLSHHGDLHSFKESKLQDDVEALRKEINEKDKSIKQANIELNTTRNESYKLKSNLKEQYDKYEMFEQTVRSKLTEIIQLKEENKHLNANLSQAQQNSAQQQHLVREVEVLRAELSKKSGVSNEDLAAIKYQNEKLQAENAKLSEICLNAKGTYENELGKAKAELQRVREQHSKDQQAAQNQIRELSSEVERAFAAYSDVNKNQSAHLDQTQKLKSENEKLSAELNSLKTKCKESEREVEQANSSVGQYKNHINQLTLEVQEARNLRAKYDEDQKASAEMEERNTDLNKKLDIAQKKLHDFERWWKDHSAEKAKTEAIVKKNHELEAEVQNLNAKISSLSSAGNSSKAIDNEATAKLEKQLEEQRGKNQELRDANYKLLESIQAQEAVTKKLLSGAEVKKDEPGLKDAVLLTTKKFQQILPKNTELPSLNGNCSVENFEAWLQKLSEVLKKNISPVAPTQVHAPAAAAPANAPIKNVTNQGEVDQLKKSIANYKASLEQVKTQLSLVERVAEEVDKEQRNKIVELEKALQTR